EKDYQQLKIIERVASDLDLGARIVGCPIIRESDGLAMSSRNRYLGAEDRARALVLSRAIERARDLAGAGEVSGPALVAAIAETVSGEPGVTLDYAAVVDAETLEEMTLVQRPCRALVAARVGGARLIDNGAIQPPGR
ncbi:MAG: pantoate--beta-alanine ligase, partial [Coriobacteriia bacterium]|nr:pantoate--beta-alanine ligase [Coriobacteriia bacterium]